MKSIKYDYGRLLDIHSVIGAFQAASILGKDDDSEMIIKSFTKTIILEMDNYEKNLRENPFVKDIEIRRVKQLLKSCRKMLKNSIKHKVPLYLKPFYFDIHNKFNTIVLELQNLGVKTRTFKKK